MARSGTETRERILDGAERLVLDHGLAATTIDAILAESETSKGAFFHHFPSKNHLARALVERYAAGDVAFLEEFMAKAEATVDDPAMQLVEFIRRFEDAADEMVSQQPSCLYVSYVFEKQLFEDGTNDVIVGAVLAWRERLAEKLRRAAEVHPPKIAIDPDVLADHVFATFEGAFMLTRAMSDADIMRSQLELVRRYVALIFDVPAE
jgi:TetR/AcrR family transcriptional regulator, transcriptional repressor for nem operon